MRSSRFVLLAVTLSLLPVSRAKGADQSAAPALTDPTILLLRDDAARDELKITPEQRSALDELFVKNNRVLLAIRDVGPTGADATAQPYLTEVRDGIAKILTEPQRARLQGLAMQAQGYDHLSRDDIATALSLTDAQRRKLADVAADFRTKTQTLRTAGKSRSPQDLQADLNKLQAARQKQIVALLKPEQLQLWSQLLGAPFDFSKVGTGPALAPEFADIEAWIHSAPLKMESLRGQVVVVHFFAFGCYNCKNNYPWYREWQNDFAGKGVTIIGIHTPETTAEEDNAALQASLDENGLKFPVAVDKKKTMWTAWYNNIWPAVYIIDKRGRVRFWWYGELDWQGAGNQKTAHQQIELLLKEPAPQT
ncbi:MAG: redoxin domain-containing protein [Pirellulales bacterium]